MIWKKLIFIHIVCVIDCTILQFKNVCGLGDKDSIRENSVGTKQFPSNAIPTHNGLYQGAEVNACKTRRLYFHQAVQIAE